MSVHVSWCGKVRTRISQRAACCGYRYLRLGTALSKFITEYEDRILPLERTGAEWAAHFRAQAHRAGRVLDLGDALIAGTAKARSLALATRNVADFGSLDLDVANPWETP